MHFQNTPQLQLAHDFVEYTGKNIFLTGKAGTGKTTFLHEIRGKTFKRMVVVAPTGVAAINASGVTIHSFFQLAFGPYLPGYQASENNQENKRATHRFSRQKINIIRSLDLLVIDEISMVRSDMLDGIDATLRKYRRSNEPFGGVQLLMIGDLRQLSPVVKEEEWTLLQQHYETPYFFSSNALKKTHFIGIELTHVFRQSDDHFIGLLNQVRGNKLDSQTIKALNQRHIPNFKAPEGYITLTTHNYKAHNINQHRLQEVTGQTRKFKASVTGNFPEYIYPTDDELSVKIGAQVMFVKNDPSPEKRFYNGKIGKITHIDKDLISVKCVEEEDLIHVSPLEWSNIKYALDEESKEIKEQVEGTFTQMPLKLAWAITIHKSQGLTFEKAIIDAEAAFAHGQVYVALSRCKTFEGLVLSTPLRSESVKHDQLVDHFSEDIESNPPTQQQLEKQKIAFQEKLILELFQFESLQISLWALLKIIRENRVSLQNGFVAAMNVMNDEIKKSIMEVSKTFHHQLKQLVIQTDNIEENSKLQERIAKGSVYFIEKLDEKIDRVLSNLEIEVDNRQVKKSITDQVKRILEEFQYKKGCLEAVKTRFETKDYMAKRAQAAIVTLAKKKTSQKTKSLAAAESSHPELYHKLKQWRDQTATENKVAVYMVLPVNTMVELSNIRPTTSTQLKNIKGLGKKKIQLYGKELIQLIEQEVPENMRNQEINETPPAQKEVVKIPSHEITLNLWSAGKSLKEIAQERGLVETTIQGHLEKHIASGEVDINKLVAPEKISSIQELFQECGPIGLTEARDILGESFSYSELRMVKHSIVFEEEEEEGEIKDVSC